MPYTDRELSILIEGNKAKEVFFNTINKEDRLKDVIELFSELFDLEDVCVAEAIKDQPDFSSDRESEFKLKEIEMIKKFSKFRNYLWEVGDRINASSQTYRTYAILEREMKLKKYSPTLF